MSSYGLTALEDLFANVARMQFSLLRLGSLKSWGRFSILRKWRWLHLLGMMGLRHFGDLKCGCDTHRC